MEEMILDLVADDLLSRIWTVSVSTVFVSVLMV